MRKLVEDLGLESRVSFKGYVRDMLPAYQEADGFVLTSNFEGQPNALMEAMAAGLPCISTDCPTGPAELITPTSNGLLVPCDDVDELVSAMTFLLDNPLEAARLGNEARASIQSLTDPTVVADRFLEYCHQMGI